MDIIVDAKNVVRKIEKKIKSRRENHFCREKKIFPFFLIRSFIMKINYDLDIIVGALSYYDIKGLLKLVDNNFFAKGEPSLSEMEEIFKKKFLKLKGKEKQLIEHYMLSCARENSIGF